MAIVLITAIVVALMYGLYIVAYISERISEEEVIYEN